jgi:putative iron-dependent peroxidase
MRGDSINLMAHPQIGIFSLGDSSQAHFELNLRSGEDARALARALIELEKPHSTVSGVNLVVGFRPSLWAQLAPSDSPAVRDFDRPIAGPDGYTMPATQHDAWLWFSGASYDVIFDQARAAMKAIAPFADVAFELTGWAYQHSRDLTGFEDGTANPSLLEAPSIVLVPDGSPGAGGTIALLQQWRHKMDAFEALDARAQELVIGRTKDNSEELPEDDMPEDSHVARTELHDAAGEELPIFRRSVPYGTLGDHGLMFVGFAQEQQRLLQMLLNMAGIGGPRDALTRFSEPLTGSFYFVPSIEALMALT